MKRFTLYILSAFFVFNANAQSIKDSAANWYQEEQFEQAIQAWQSILDKEGESAAVYYNLGNAYFKLDKTALSILNYERALLLEPENEDIQHNLQVAQATIKDRVEAIPELFFIVWLNNLNMWISGTAWGIISIITFILMLSLLLWRLFRRTRSGSGMITYSVIALFVLSGLTLLLAIRAERLKSLSNDAIIMEDVMVKSSPSETGTNLFEVHEGLKIEVLDSVNNFAEIKLTDGKKGWISADKAESIK